MGPLRGRRPLLSLACALALLTLATPVADVLAFGIHEHTVLPGPGNQERTASDQERSPSSHHCELSTSQAVSVPAPIVVTAGTGVLGMIGGSDTPVLSFTPFVLVAPPRF
jgi:hypothetical protein